METEAEIPEPICETRREEIAKVEDQATIFPPTKLPKEEKIQPDQLDELPETTKGNFNIDHEKKGDESNEQTFEDDQILGTPSITKISSDANDISLFSCKLAEKQDQTVNNDTEVSFLRSNKIDDQPLENIATSTKDTNAEEGELDKKRSFADDLATPAEKLSCDENTSAESIIDSTCNNELQEEENDTFQKDETSVTIPEDSEKVLENAVNDSQEEVRYQSKTLEEIAKTHSNLTTTEKTGENLPIQVEESQKKNDECLEKENDDTSQAEVTTVPDKIKFEEEVTFLKGQTEKPEELLHAAVIDIKASALGQDTETKNALKDEGFIAEPRERVSEKTEETVNEVVQTEESPVVQNVSIPVSNEEIEDNSVNKVEETREKYEECLEKDSKESPANKNLMKRENDAKEAAVHEPKVEKVDQLKSDISETQNNTLLEVEPQIEKPVQSLQDGSEEIRTVVSSQNMMETIFLEKKRTTDPQEILDDQTKEESHENISKTEENSVIQVGGSGMEVEEHFKDSEKPSFTETCNNDAIENDGLIRSESLENEEHKESILQMEEAQKEISVESFHVAREDMNTSTLSQDDGTTNSFAFSPLENIAPEENQVKGIQENAEAANSVTTNAELSEENLRDTCIQNVEIKESSENAKEETFSFLQSEPSNEMNSHEFGADELNPEASKPNDNATEHNIVKEEISYDGKAETGPLIDTSTDEISLKEVYLDDKRHYAEDLDGPADKLRHKEDTSETIIDATSNKDELQDLMKNTVTERQEEEQSQSKTMRKNSEIQSNPTATEKSGENSPVQGEECLEKENDNLSLTGSTNNVNFEEDLSLLKEELVKPEEFLHAAVTDIKASALGEDIETKCFLKDGSNITEPREILSDETEERNADVVAPKEETYENISIAVPNEETEENSKTEVADSQVKHEECFEKESTESSTSKALVKDDFIHELNVESEENGLLKVEAQTEKHVESIQDASEDIDTAVSSQYMQNLRADPQENLDDQIENRTMDVHKDETLEIQNIAKTEENSVIQVNGSEMELEEHLDDTEKPSFTETCNRDAILLEDEKNKESTLLTEEAEEKRPVDSLHVTHEDIKAFASSPCIDDKATESLQVQSSAIIVPSEDTEENSSIQHLAKDSEKPSLANADLPEVMHEAEIRDPDLQKEELFCSEKNAESTLLKKLTKIEEPTEHLPQATEGIESSNLNQDIDTTCSLAEESLNANQQELLGERTEERTAEAVDRKDETVEHVPTTASSEQTEGSSLIGDAESIVSHEPRVEECLEKENDNLTMTEATRDYIQDDASSVTDNVKSEEEIALLKEEMVKPDESLHAAVDDNKASDLGEETETKCFLKDGSHTEEPQEILSDKTRERAADVVVPKEETSEIQNISIAVSDKETEDNSKTEVDDSQVKHEEYFEKEDTESSTNKAILKDDSIHELKVENEENSLLDIEAQPEKHVQSSKDASEDIETAVSSQNIEQNLRADPQENLDDQIGNRTMDVEKDETLENSVIQVNGSEKELEHFNDSKKPSFTETFGKDAIEDEGLRRSVLLENEKNKESTLLTEEAQEERPVESLHVAREDIKAFASSPCIDDKKVESLQAQSAATFVLDKDTEENSSIQHLAKDSENLSLVTADLPEIVHEAEIGDGDLQKEELFCSEKNVESTLLKKEVHIEEPIEHLQQSTEAIELSNTNQDTDTTCYISEESLDANKQELLGERTEERTYDAIDRQEETVADVPTATSSEQTEGNSLIGDTESTVSHEPKVESKSDLCDNTLLEVEAMTEKPVQTVSIALEDIKAPVSSQNMNRTYPVEKQTLNADHNETLDQKIEAIAMDTAEIKETPIENVATIVSNEETREEALIQVDGFQHKQEEQCKEKSEQQYTIETFTRDIDDDEKPIIMEKLKNEDEDLSKAELFQNEENRECTLINEETQEEKPVESLHSAPEDYNSLEKEAQDEKSIEYVHVAPKDALSQNTEIEKEIVDEVAVESLHVTTKEDAMLNQVTEVATREAEEEKHVESSHVAQQHDEALIQNMEVTNEEAEEVKLEELHVAPQHDSQHDEALSQKSSEDDKALNQDVKLEKEEADGGKALESLHVAPQNDKALLDNTEVAKEEVGEEKLVEVLLAARNDDKTLTRETEVEKEEAEGEKLVESLHSLDDDKALEQDIEVAKEENNDKPLTHEREVEKEVEGEKPIESSHALDDDKSLSQTIEVAKEEEEEDVVHGNDNSLCQDMEAAKDKIKEEDKHVAALHVASENKPLGQDNEIVKEEADEEIITESMHVVHVDDKALIQGERVANEEAEENKPLEPLHVACENDNSPSQDTKIAKEDEEEEKYVMSLPVACEEENSLSQDKEIAKAETEEETSVKSLDVASEDDKVSNHKTEVTEKENLVETLSVAPEDEALSQDTTVVKDEAIEKKTILTLHAAPEHDIALCQDMEVVKKEIEDEKPIESLHVAPNNDSEDTPAKEDEDNIVASHQAPEYESKEMKEEVDGVICQLKVQEEPETTKKDSDADLQVTHNQHNVTPHSIDTEVTTHESVDIVQETTELEGNCNNDNIGNVHNGGIVATDSNKKQKLTEFPIQEVQEINQECDEHSHSSTQIIQEGIEEMTNLADSSAKEVKEVMPCEEEKRIMELETEVPVNIENVDHNEEATDIIKEERDLKDLQMITAVNIVTHEKKGTDVQYITNPETQGSDATEELMVNISKDSDCNKKELSSTEVSEEAQVSHEKYLDVASLVSEASEEGKSDHKNVGEIGCKEGMELKKLEVLEDESTTISTKENVELCGASTEASDLTQEMPKLEGASQAAVNEITLENKKLTSKEIANDFLPREAALLEDHSTTERELHIGKTEALENEEAKTEKNEEEDVSEHKRLECSSGNPIMTEAKGKDLSELSDEENNFQEIDTREIVKDDDGLIYNAIKVKASSESKEISVPESLEVLDSVTQDQNCIVISEAEEAKLEEKKFETAPAETKSAEIVSQEKPKAATYEATETIADMSKEKIHEEDQDTENNHIGSCDEEIIRGSCQENEANQGEKEYEFIINPYENKEAKDSNIEFLEAIDNKAIADSVDPPVVNAAGQELQEKLNEDAVHEAEPSELIQKTIEDCEGNGGYTNTTTMIQQDDNEIKHKIQLLPEGSLGKESEKWDKTDENCTSDKVELKDENTVMLEAEKSEEKEGEVDILRGLTEDDNKSTCIEAAKLEIPVDKQVELEVEYTENVNPDSSICDKNALVSESKDSKESSSLTEAETLKPSKQDQEEFNCGKDERISKETTEEIEKFESVEDHTPSLSDLLHKVSAKETLTPTAVKFTTEKEPALHGEELKPENSHEAEHEKSKTNEQKDDEEESGEHHKSDSSSEAPVMVEAGDADVKVAHKKSHNLLSGVGSKVKHSIAKVKKAITGKSPHPKPRSPK